MMLILTHEKADFDAIASQLGASKLFPAAIPLLPRHINRNVHQFLNLYWDSLPFIRPGDWKRRPVNSLILVDTQTMGNVRGVVAGPDVHVIDHHLGQEPKPNWTYEVEAVGATVTILVEKIQARGLVLTPEEATLLLLGIYEDTGNLIYDTTTVRDARAAAWLLENRAQLHVARRFLGVALSDLQQELYDRLLHQTEWVRIEERPVALTMAEAPVGFDDEISSVAHRLRETLTPDGLFVLVQLSDGVQLVARSSVDEIDAAYIAKFLGGGGHSRAAAAMIVGGQLHDVRQKIVTLLPQAVRPSLRVAAIMSYGVVTVPSTTSVSEVAILMQKLGHEGYPVIDVSRKKVVGLITRRAVDRAMSNPAFARDLGEQPISRIMNAGTITVRPSDTLVRVQELMSSEGWGQIPVLPELDDPSVDQNGLPIGIVTRTDLINTLFKPLPGVPEADMRDELALSFSPELWSMVLAVSETAADLHMPIYFVGGLVRDLLLEKLPTDIDLVVEGDAIRLVNDLNQRFGGIVHSHDRFGTAKWLLTPEVYQEIADHVQQTQIEMWDVSSDTTGIRNEHRKRVPPPRQVDFVTARKEFYKHPTALPDVEPGSIKLDLHRRDFTINTLAIRLDGAYLGQLLDFYNGRRDLRRGMIRVLHSLSFIDDPTRILRAVRLEQRLGFTIDEGTEELIHNALPFLDRVTGDRIRNEIEQALNEADPVQVMERLDELGALGHIYPGLGWKPESAAVFRRIPQSAEDPIWGLVYSQSSLTFFYFAAWLAPFPAPIPENVARRLKARKVTIADVAAISELHTRLAELPADAPPSQVYFCLLEFAPRVLLLMRLLESESRFDKWLDQYAEKWSKVKPVISGDDLRKLGIPPGPVYSKILNTLMAARLDGEITTDTAEIARLNEMVSTQGLTG